MSKRSSHQDHRAGSKKSSLASGLTTALLNSSGTTTIEFAILAFPFLILILAILDLALMFFSDSMLDEGLSTIARKIKTGQITTANTSQASLKSLFCSSIASVFDCDKSVFINVTTVSDYSSVSLYNPIQSDGSLSSSLTFDTGSAGDYVLVQGYLKWTSPTYDLIGSASRLDDGTILLSSAVLFKNETYK